MKKLEAAVITAMLLIMLMVTSCKLNEVRGMACGALFNSDAGIERCLSWRP